MDIFVMSSRWQKLISHQQVETGQIRPHNIILLWLELLYLGENYGIIRELSRMLIKITMQELKFKIYQEFMNTNRFHISDSQFLQNSKYKLPAVIEHICVFYQIQHPGWFHAFPGICMLKLELNHWEYPNEIKDWI